MQIANLVTRVSPLWALSRSNLTLSASLLVFLSHRLFRLWSNWRQICKSRAHKVKNAGTRKTRVRRAPGREYRGSSSVLVLSLSRNATILGCVGCGTKRAPDEKEEEPGIVVGTSDRLDFQPLFEKGARVPLLAEIESRLPTAAKYLGKSRTFLAYGSSRFASFMWCIVLS